MAYITTTELKTYLGTTGTAEDTQLAAIIGRAQQQIESYCHRKFEESTGIRYYRENDLIPMIDYPTIGGSGTVLLLDEDILSIETLSNGDDTGTEITSTGYWLEPRNANTNGKPYQYIRLRSSKSWIFGTDGEINVKGTWGYSTAPPEDIVQATLRLSAFIYRQRDSSVFDVTAIPELGVMTVPQGIPRDVTRILKDGDYIRKTRIT